MLDIQKIRKDFSIFKNNEKLVYLDSAATSLTPDIVVDEMSQYYKNYRTSIHRGSYKIAERANNKYENSRQKIAEFLKSEPHEIIFTKSTTSSLNAISRSLKKFLKEGDEIIVTNLEHHSNFLPWLKLSQELNLKLKIVEAQDKHISISSIEKMITSKTRIVAIHHVSNVIGDEVDIEQLCKILKKRKIFSVIDGAQGSTHLKVDLNKIQPDFYTISAHKMLGPTGLGILYINEKIHNELDPFEYGGDMVEPSSVYVDKYQVKSSPFRFEAGTPSIAEVIGMGKAIEYLDNIGMENIQQHVEKLKIYCVQQLKQIKNKVIIYNEDVSGNIVVFNIKNVAVHDAVAESPLSNVTFDTYDIAIRDGQHCNNLTMVNVLNETAVLRASFYLYNDYEDIDKLVEVINKIYDKWN